MEFGRDSNSLLASLLNNFQVAPGWDLSKGSTLMNFDEFTNTLWKQIDSSSRKVANDTTSPVFKMHMSATSSPPQSPLLNMVPDELKDSLKYKLMNKATGKGGRQGERVYTIDDCGPTICASSGGPGAKTGLYEVKPGKIRTLTVPETLQMFGFSPDYKYETLAAKKRMLFYLGNSIVINVLDEMVKGLSSVLGSHGDGF
jgi:hypothetical protein